MLHLYHEKQRECRGSDLIKTERGITCTNCGATSTPIYDRYQRVNDMVNRAISAILGENEDEDTLTGSTVKARSLFDQFNDAIRRENHVLSDR